MIFSLTAHASLSRCAQNFLEADPYWDQSTIPVNTFKNKAPHTAKVVSVKRIVGPEATGETCHIIMDHKGEMPYWEGQSYGVIPPGTNPKNGKPHTVRLYSIASSRCESELSPTPAPRRFARRARSHTGPYVTWMRPCGDTPHAHAV